MKLWEAMLRGSKLSKQCTTVISNDDGGRCAIGAVLDGSGVVCSGLTNIDAEVKLRELYPIVEQGASCPVKDGICGVFFSKDLTSIIWHLNDRHRWFREDIAYWIRDTFETEKIVENNVKEIQHVN